MKNIAYKFMLMVVASTFVACSNDNDVELETTTADSDGSINFVSTIGDNLEILATEDLDNPQAPSSRATFDSSNKLTSWETSDKISISDGALMYTYQPQTAGTKAEFQPRTGKNSFPTDKAGTFYAFYPAAAVLGWNGSTVSTMIYTEQKYSENVESSGVMGPYMAAVATTTDGGSSASFTFGHICSVIDVDLSTFDGGEVESVALYANSQVSVAGSVKFDISTKTATVSGNDGAGYSYSLQSEVVRVSEINAERPTVRFYVLPVKQTAGFTITVRTTTGKYYTKKSERSVGTSAANEDYLSSIKGVTSGEICKPYYKKYKFGAISGARTQNWMAMIPGNIKFNHLSLPGAHDAATSSCSGTFAYAAKCQAHTITELLTKGCRALDLRPYYNSSSLEIYHGSYSTGVNLADALDAVKDFLVSNPTETVFILIAQEGGSDGNANWQNRVWTCLSAYSSNIASYGWEGNLNPCRGKMVIIFRNTYTGGTNNGDLGCGKVGWGGSFADKSILTGNGSGTARGTLRYQDEYETTSTSTKLENLTKMLNEHIARNETNAAYTFVNNTNIAGTLSNISDLSASMNTAFLASSAFTNHTGKFGIMMTDFLFSSSQKGDQMFELIHKQNYKYVYKNRTRCVTTSTSGEDSGVDISADEYADDGTVYARESNF